MKWGDYVFLSASVFECRHAFRKRKYEDEKRGFQTEREEEFVFLESNQNILSLKTERYERYVMRAALWSPLLYSVQWKGDRWMMHWKWCGRKRSWPNSRHYIGVCLEGQENHGKSRDNRSSCRDFNPRPPEYETKVLTTRPRRWVP
jgi:hypothetical protein